MSAPSPPLHVLHVVSDLSSSSGGPARVITGMADALANDGRLRVSVLTQRSGGSASLQPASPSVEFTAVPSAGRAARAVRTELGRVTAEDAVHIIHSHGLWLPVNHWASAAARKSGAISVLQPHGMLHPWAMKHRRWKKWLAMRAFQWRDLRAARALVATSDEECAHIRDLGLRQPVAIIPNGISLPPPVAASQQPGQRQGRTALFIGRIHPIKGLPSLLRAWAAVRPPGWRLTLAGPDEADHLRDVLELARALRVNAELDYVGPATDEAKDALFRRADLFILPSLSENFGVAVAEALSHGLPVITTTGTPWSELARQAAGWWVDPAPEALADALRLATSAPPETRKAMGERGLELVRRYQWNTVASDLADVYRWLASGGAQPACVRAAGT